MTTEEKCGLQTVFLMAAYFVSLLVLGVSWWKALAISFVIIAAYVLSMWSRWITRAAAVLLVVAFVAWVDLLPAQSHMRAFATEQFVSARAWQCSRQASVGLQNAQ